QAFSETARLHMVEISPALKARQQETLRAHGDRIEWHESFETIPDDPVLIIANEFFDALPIRQYVGHGERWQERRIGLADDGSLAFTLGPRALGTDIMPVEDAILEVSPLSTAIVRGWAERIGRQGGAALIIDYGHTETAVGETLQAVRAHEYVEVLADPGDADLTAHVDFAALRAACEGTGAICHGPMPQGDFLLALGLLERAGQLGRDKDNAARQVIRDAIERLAGPDQMGHLFKVLAVTGGDFRPLPFSGD
ncbi:MAG TPA: SAM-dependent methyltransferase, partial [Afifellaceae bacterium]|nr:SAM-dependent methyltransferase [Afifellaceae bacterium]